jgi:predicted enzyme related to lactoylglutathione lyase
MVDSRSRTRDSHTDGDASVIDYQGRFVWYELITTDFAAARAFYTKVMGWGAQDASMPHMAYTFFTVGNTPASGLTGLPEAARKAGMRPGWLGYVAVDDVDAAVDRIRRLGGAVHVPPTNLLDVSRFAIVADLQMVPLALVKSLKPGTQGLGEPSQLGRVGWHELLAVDCEAAFDFYGQLFDWRKADAGDAHADGATPYHLIAAGDQTIGGMYVKRPLVPNPVWLYYFNVRDIDAAVARVTAAGGQVMEGPLKVPGGNWIASCIDPQGAMFALESQQDRPVGYFAPAARRPPNL